MRRLPCRRVLVPVVATVAVAELAARLLSPHRPALDPAEIDLHSYFSEAELARGRRYARPQRALGAASAAVEALSLCAVAFRPPRTLRGRGRRPMLDGAIASCALTVVLALPPLPLRVLARRRAIAVGLATQPWRGWLSDLVKSTAIEAGFAAVGGSAIVALTRRYPRHWWLPAAGGSVLVGAAFATLGPIVLSPLFNDFTPLPEGQTRSDVLELAGAAGVEVGEVYSVDASRRTTAANAYVTGLGPSKRVVLYDTLLDRYSRDEIRCVVAHELAHVRGRDVPRGLLYAALVAPAGALAVQRLSWVLSPERGSAAALPVLALAAGVVGAPTGLAANRLSRAIERRADAFSLELSGAPEAFISFERAIALQNVADLDPPRWVTRLLATHPSTAQRIGYAVAFTQTRAGEARP